MPDRRFFTDLGDFADFFCKRLYAGGTARDQAGMRSQYQKPTRFFVGSETQAPFVFSGALYSLNSFTAILTKDYQDVQVFFLFFSGKSSNQVNHGSGAY